MFLTVDTSITIRAAADAVWDYACKPANWTASNPTEHFGLTFDSPDNLPHAGVTFTQRESVAGIRAVLHGRFHYMDRPRLAFWTGTAAYRVLGGVLTIRLPEGGVLSLVEDQDGVLSLVVPVLPERTTSPLRPLLSRTPLFQGATRRPSERRCPMNSLGSGAE